MLSAVGQTYGYVHSSAKQLLIKTKIMFVLGRLSLVSIFLKALVDLLCLLSAFSLYQKIKT